MRASSGPDLSVKPLSEMQPFTIGSLAITLQIAMSERIAGSCVFKISIPRNFAGVVSRILHVNSRGNFGSFAWFLRNLPVVDWHFSESFCVLYSWMAHATMSTDHEVATILRSFWEWRLRESPEFATQIGVHTYDSNLDGHSLEAYARRQVYLYQVRLVSTSYDGLSSFKEVATLHSECYVENLVRESLFTPPSGRGLAILVFFYPAVRTGSSNTPFFFFFFFFFVVVSCPRPALGQNNTCR